MNCEVRDALGLCSKQMCSDAPNPNSFGGIQVNVTRVCVEYCAVARRVLLLLCSIVTLFYCSIILLFR